MALPFHRKHAAAAAVAVLSFAALVAMGIDAVSRLRADVAAAALARSFQASLDSVLIRTLDLESRQRAYLQTRHPEQLDRFRAASAQLEGELARLSATLSDHPEQAQQHERLAALVEQRRAVLEGEVAHAATQAPIGSGQPLRDEILQLMASMRDEEMRLLEVQHQQTSTSLRRAAGLGAALAALAALLLLASYRLMRREHAAQSRALRSEATAREAAERQAEAEARHAARAAAALDDSEARLRGVFDSATAAILVADDTQTIVMANPAAATVFRCPLPQVLGAPLERFIPERLGPQHRRDVQAFGAGDAGARRMGARPDVCGRRADGQEFPVDASISHLKVEGRHQYMVILRDVTELRRAQDELARSHDELRRLVAAQEAVRENERKRIAREIHDELQQTLAAIKIDLGAIAAHVRADPGGALTMLGEADRLAAEAVASTRRIVNDLRPRLLDDLGLVPALEVLLEQFAQRYGIRCHLEASDGDGSELQAHASMATCLYRITQEALQNVAKHAGATRVDVLLSEPRSGWLQLRIADDGGGFAADDLRKPQSFGLIGMRERVRALGGRLEVASPPQGGTAIEVELPLPATA